MRGTLFIVVLLAVIVAFALPPLANMVTQADGLPDSVVAGASTLTPTVPERVGTATSFNPSGEAASPQAELPPLDVILALALGGGGVALLMSIIGLIKRTLLFAIRAVIVAGIGTGAGTGLSPFIAEYMCPLLPDTYCPSEDKFE